MVRHVTCKIARKQRRAFLIDTLGLPVIRTSMIEFQVASATLNAWVTMLSGLRQRVARKNRPSSAEFISA